MTPLNDVLQKTVDPRAIEAGWERVRARRDRPRTARRVMLVVPALAIAALLVFVLRTFFVAPHASQPIALAGGAPLPEDLSALSATVVALDDGSKLEIDPATKLRPTPKKADPARVELTLESGATTFDVKPNGPRTWVIDAGDIVVRVLGTRFRVERNGQNVDVKVERGKVSVEGAGVEGGAKLLVAGESIHVGDTKPPTPVKHAIASPPQVVPSVVSPQALPTVNEPAAPKTTKPAHIAALPPTLIAAPAKEAKDAPRSTPSPATPTSSSTTESAPLAAEPAAAAPPPPAPVAAPIDPMASADAARRAGRPREAVTILAALVDRKDGRAPLAAFTLGKIHAEDLGDQATAAVWFERAIAFGLPRGLDEEAQARAVESHAKAGRRVDAARAAARYESSFPNGRHLERVRSFVRN